MALDSATYYVMKHYSISLTEIKTLSKEEFSQMLVWAVSSDKLQQEQVEKQTAGSKSQMPVAGTDTGGPMPFSDGW